MISEHQWGGNKSKIHYWSVLGVRITSDDPIDINYELSL
jgi:hypothetical protein